MSLPDSPGFYMEPVADSDVSLMMRLSDGDDLALNEIMNRWRERVASFLLRMVSDHATALDLTQETFVKLYANRHRYRPSAAFSTYLFHIAANLARSQARWRKRHPTVPLGDENHGEDPPTPDLAPDASSELKEKTACINRAIAALPEEQREALLLFTVEGLSQQEVASVLNCSAKAVELRVYKARQTLREAMSREGF